MVGARFKVRLEDRERKRKQPWRVVRDAQRTLGWRDSIVLEAGTYRLDPQAIWSIGLGMKKLLAHTTAPCGLFALLAHTTAPCGLFAPDTLPDFQINNVHHSAMLQN
jgi:hypothetical protein